MSRGCAHIAFLSFVRNRSILLGRSFAILFLCFFVSLTISCFVLSAFDVTFDPQWVNQLHHVFWLESMYSGFRTGILVRGHLISGYITLSHTKYDDAEWM